ncbi:unnamed protein product, partial [Prorocentrum cordatum]
HFGLLLREGGKEPGKTGVDDESILFDLEGWLSPLLAAIELCALPEQPPLGEAIALLQKLFASACRELSLQRFRPRLQRPLRVGASGDMLSQRTSLPEIQRRGRRRSTTSLSRDTRETWLLDELAWSPPAAQELGAFVEDNLVALVEGLLSALPPALGTRAIATGGESTANGGAGGAVADGGPDAIRRHLRRQCQRAAVPGRRLRRRPALGLFCGAGASARAMAALNFAAFGLDWGRGPLGGRAATTFQTVDLGLVRGRRLAGQGRSGGR